MTTIPELLEAIVVQTKDGDLYGESQIDQLRKARYASVGGTRTGATDPAETTVMNLAADLVWVEVTQNVAGYYSAAVTDVPLRTVRKLPELYIHGWVAAVLARIARREDDDADTALLAASTLEKLQEISNSIMNLIDPVARPLRIECPVCGLSQIEVGEKELRVLTATIVRVSRPGEELVIVCRNPACNGQWIGDQQIINLGRQTNEIIDPEKIREARSTATVEITWDEPTKRVEPYDPTNPDHVALRRTVTK